ncbi:hypothetical protein RI129_000199 [Pyrocoelia pectoralis]|uniref:Dynein regulatory complex subunit 2 n=1 Tax=Pyrocoelia pectoralis TaxID=417401 RepID=A0AAN7ZBQ7_9COLE
MPLSAEAKAALKLAKKEQKLREQELQRRKLKHDEISREVKYSQLTLKSNEKKWRRILIEISLPRMRSELEYAWHNFERIIDVKDFTISYLLDELDQAEEQYVMNLKCHSEHVDSLINRFNDHLQELKLGNEEQELLVRGEYLSKLDEESSKYKNIIRTLRVGLEKNYADLWGAIKTFLHNYQETTNDRRKSYNILASQDELLQNVCSKQSIKILRMQDLQKTLKRQYLQLQKSQKQKISDLLNEQKYFADTFTTLKLRMANDVKIDTTNLNLLIDGSNATRTHLNGILAKGRKVKILPFPTYDTDNGRTENIEIDDYRSLASLDLFWKRVAQADGIRHAINEEREYLKRENKKLQSKIHYYCMCVDCPGLAAEDLQRQTSGKPHITEGHFMRSQYDKFK